MDFSSDTSAPAHPSVIDALGAANSGQAGSYGNDDLTKRLERTVKEIFETDNLVIWPVASGTASNALALSCICPPTSSIICHREAHIERDERGAPEFFTGGAKLHLLDGPDGKLQTDALAQTLATVQPGFVHETPPAVLSLTNLTECGTAYTPGEIAALATLAHNADLKVHLDGARFANALASQKVSPAEMSWRAGVDVLTLGLTKTGAMGCEIIVMFGADAASQQELAARAKRSGHMPPKLRYISAQGLALLGDGTWMELASLANRQARHLAGALLRSGGASLAYPVDGNEVFIHLRPEIVDALTTAGAQFFPWPGDCHRFVCSWTTPASAIDEVAEVIARAR